MARFGILLDEAVFRRVGRGKMKECIRLYNKAAAKVKLTPVYFSLKRVDPARGKTGARKYVHGKYRNAKLVVPRVIHNRAMPSSGKERAAMRWLNKHRYVFNASNRYSKYRIYRMLRDKFMDHLPATIRYTRTNLARMMRNHRNLFVKPQRGSVGEGVINLTRISDGKWRVRTPSGKRVLAGRAASAKVHRMARTKPYLIQQGISLARWKGRPYDIRVSVQRDGTGNWQVTGMVGKVARRGSHLTNLARAGTARKSTVLFARSFQHPDSVAEAVRKLSLEIATHLGSRLRHLADLGLDIGVDEDGRPLLIEVNCRDQRYSFRKAGMWSTFAKCYENPVLYARYLMQNRREPL